MIPWVFLMITEVSPIFLMITEDSQVFSHDHLGFPDFSHDLHLELMDKKSLSVLFNYMNFS